MFAKDKKNTLSSFDVCILGAGPGGYVAAIRASQLGLKVALVESEELGGICLNWGCIPTKALLTSAEVFSLTKNASKYGVVVGNPRADLEAMRQRSRDVSKRLTDGIKALMKKNKISVFSGYGKVTGKDLVTVYDNKNKELDSIKTKYIILSTGARARDLKGFEADHKLIWNYKSAMSQSQMPKSLVVVGSGAIGLEFATFYSLIGVDVTVMEIADRICPLEDKDISSYAKKVFESNGIKFCTSVSIKNVKKEKSSVIVNYSVNGESKSIKVDRLLMAVGTVPNSKNIGLESVAVNLENDRIKVDENCKTNVDNIYAIGDVNSKGPFLAHKASHEGICVVEKIASLEGKLDPASVHNMHYDSIPSCTYTSPQIASVGMTEQQAIDKGYTVKVGKFSAIANGKAIATSKEDGLVKVIFDKRTGELLGSHMFGHTVTEIIQGFSIAKTGELTEEEIIQTIFPHPTISEMMHEAVLSALGRALHS